MNKSGMESEAIKKSYFIRFTLYNILIVCIFVFGFYLLLPLYLQKSLSLLLFIFAGIVGTFLGSLIAKIFNLKKRIEKNKEREEKRFNNIQTYLANVVHDLRSPVASINMISELLEDDLENVTPQQRELLKSITKSSSTMLERICYILDNTKYEKGIDLENINSNNPYELICSAIKKHEILALEKNITIKNTLSNNIPNVFFDKEALDSVVSNLISNAIKYSLPNTSILVYQEISKGKAVFYIKDQGLGMTSEDLKRVFGEYAKLSARPTGNENSSGLGLSIVKKLVENMGGQVQAYSEGKDKGSTFSFSLKTSVSVKTISA